MASAVRASAVSIKAYLCLPVGDGCTHVQTSPAGGGACKAHPPLSGGQVLHVSTHGYRYRVWLTANGKRV